MECPSPNQFPSRWRRLVHAQVVAGAFGTRSAAALRMHTATPAKGIRSSARPLVSILEGGPLIGIDGPWWYLLHRDAAGDLRDGLLERPSPNRIPLRWSRHVHAYVVAGAFGTRSAATLSVHDTAPAKGEQSFARPPFSIYEGLSPLGGIGQGWRSLRRDPVGDLGGGPLEWPSPNQIRSSARPLVSNYVDVSPLDGDGGRLPSAGATRQVSRAALLTFRRRLLVCERPPWARTHRLGKIIFAPSSYVVGESSVGIAGRLIHVNRPSHCTDTQGWNDCHRLLR